MNLGAASVGRVAHSKMRTLVVGRNIAAAAHDVLALAYAIGVQVYGCPDRVARAFGAPDEFQLHPVMAIGVDVLQQNRRTIDGADDHVNPAVVEQVSERRAAS